MAKISVETAGEEIGSSALSVEEFAVRLAKHFTSLYQQWLSIRTTISFRNRHPNNENSDQLYGDMVEKSIAILQEATSQLPPDTPIEDVIVPKDADVQIVTEVNSLKEEVTTLRGQVAAQGDHIRAHDERMNMIVQALAMSGLQIPMMPAPNVAPPSTSFPATSPRRYRVA
ncbi:unnamed protein product [Malus baccata var. baccata]